MQDGYRNAREHAKEAAMEAAVKQGYMVGLAEGFKLGKLKGAVTAALAKHAVQTVRAGGGAGAARGDDANTVAMQSLVAKVVLLEARLAETLHDPDEAAAGVRALATGSSGTGAGAATGAATGAGGVDETGGAAKCFGRLASSASSCCMISEVAS